MTNIFFKILKKSNIKRYYFFLFISILFSFACENDIEKINDFSQIDDLPDISAKNIEITYTDSGKVKAILFAKKLEKYITEKKVYTEFEQGIDVKFYNEFGQLESTIQSNYGRFYDDKRIFIAENDVVIRNHLKEEQLNTEYLVWEQVTEIIYSDKFVKITTPDNIIYGNGFEAKQNFQNPRIREVKGVISVDKQ